MLFTTIFLSWVMVACIFLALGAFIFFVDGPRTDPETDEQKFNFVMQILLFIFGSIFWPVVVFAIICIFCFLFGLYMKDLLSGTYRHSQKLYTQIKNDKVTKAKHKEIIQGSLSIPSNAPEGALSPVEVKS